MQQCSNDQIEKIIDLFRSIQRRMREIASQKFKAYGFTLPQLGVIFILHEKPNIMLSELSQEMELSQSTVSSIVDRLVNQGVVVREIPKDNRRTVRLFLSPQFIENNKSILDKNKFLVDVLNFQGLSPEDANTIIYALEKLGKLFLPAPQKTKENPVLAGNENGNEV